MSGPSATGSEGNGGGGGFFFGTASRPAPEAGPCPVGWFGLPVARCSVCELREATGGPVGGEDDDDGMTIQGDEAGVNSARSVCLRGFSSPTRFCDLIRERHNRTGPVCWHHPEGVMKVSVGESRRTPYSHNHPREKKKDRFCHNVSSKFKVLVVENSIRNECFFVLPFHWILLVVIIAV